MGFSVRVHISGAGSFRVHIASPGATLEDVNEAIESSNAGRSIAYSAAWHIFLADENGAPRSGPLPRDHDFSPATDSTMDVWVAPKAHAAGEA
jgi:hypothetical protein